MPFITDEQSFRNDRKNVSTSDPQFSSTYSNQPYEEQVSPFQESSCLHCPNVPWLGGLLVLSPVLESPISGVKAQPLNAAPKCHRPHSTEHKTPRLMVKPQPRTPKETHTLRLRTEQEKRNEKKKRKTGVENEESNQVIKQIQV